MSILPIFGRTFSLILVFMVLASSCKDETRMTLLLHSQSDERSVGMATHLLLQGFPHLLDAGPPDEFGQLKRGLLYAPLPLEVLPFEAPVTWHWDRVPGGLQVHQQLGLLGCHIMHLHHIWTCHQLERRGRSDEATWPIHVWPSVTTQGFYLFELSHCQPVHPPQLLLWHFGNIWSDFLDNNNHDKM